MAEAHGTILGKLYKIVLKLPVINYIRKQRKNAWTWCDRWHDKVDTCSEDEQIITGYQRFSTFT